MTVSAITPPHMLPMGTPQPPDQRHAISVSLPTWDSVPGRPLGKKWVVDTMQTTYPRFGQHIMVQALSNAVLKRIAAPSDANCSIFTSKDAGVRCIEYLRKHHCPNAPVDLITFHISGASDPPTKRWAQFCAVIHGNDLQKDVGRFWAIFGDGISSRHAEFCLERWHYMSLKPQTYCLEPSTPDTETNQPPKPAWASHDQDAKDEIKTRIATLIQSDNLELPTVSPDDVFLYPKGMCAISAVARALLPDMGEPSGAVVYGWPYSDTPKCVEGTGYSRFKIYSEGSQQELDELSSSLASGARIQVLFCELPSNPLLHTPDLHRIRGLADEHGFCVVCDETIGTYINVDVLPYVDVAITSLSKLFSGGSNVMGGSAVINPQSSHYERIHARLTHLYEDLLFPGDAMVLGQNSRDFEDRVLKCNSNALPLAMLLATCPYIDAVHYPKLASTRSLYERYRRKRGGYGFLLSLVFRRPTSAVEFFNNLDICKGPSLGTNFSLALPYAQLSHVFELDWAESHGVPKHIVRVSVGLESKEELLDRFRDALRKVEEHEKTFSAE